MAAFCRRLNGDLEAVLDMIYDPFDFRRWLGSLAFTNDFANQLVDTAFDGIGTA